MNKNALIFGGLGLAALVVGVVAFSGGDAHAASAEPGLTGGSPAARALLAIGTADAQKIQNAALVLSSEAPAIASGLVRASEAIKNLASVDVQYRALTLQAISGLDVPSITAMAANLQNLRYQSNADEIRVLGQFIQWLKDGARAAAIAATAATPAAVPTGPVTPAQVAQVAQAADTTEQEAAKLAAIIATGDIAKMRAALDVYTRAGNQRAVEILRIAIDEATRRTVKGIDPAPAATAVATAVTEHAAQAQIPPAATPTPKVEQTPEKPERVLAGKVAAAMRTAKKNAASGLPEPKSAADLVKQFQAAEKLARVDGAYGSETALSLAERYGIVPPAPLSWGKKGGNYKTLTDDKKLYKARLAKLQADDLPRKEEWQRAIDAVKL
jgi:hypothetical protein